MGVLEIHGAGPQKQTRYTPIFTNRFFSGLWTQRSPQRDAGDRYEERYLGGRSDGLIDGSNTEVSNRLTLHRRPGNTIYNVNTFSAIDQFYAFKLQDGNTILVMADAVEAVYEATGPSNKNQLGNPPWFKQADGGQMSFQSVLDVLYLSDNSKVLDPTMQQVSSIPGGIDQKKWVKSPKTWTCNTQFFPDDFIIDPSGNIQRVARSLDLPPTAPQNSVVGPDIAGLGQSASSNSTTGGVTVQVTVPVTTWPWARTASNIASFAIAENNPSFYGTAPVLVLTTLTSGQVVKIGTISGNITLGASFPQPYNQNGGGYTTNPNTFGHFPLQYDSSGGNLYNVGFNTSTTPYTAGSGTFGAGCTMVAFTDNAGNVVSNGVFAVQGGETLIVPPGATQMQAGVSDNDYPDNTGAGFTISATSYTSAGVGWQNPNNVTKTDQVNFATVTTTSSTTSVSTSQPSSVSFQHRDGTTYNTVANTGTNQFPSGWDYEQRSLGAGIFQWRSHPFDNSYTNAAWDNKDFGWLIFTGFNNTVPVGATILGVKATYSFNGQSTSSDSIDKIQLFNGTTPIGNAKTVNAAIPTAITTLNQGDLGDNWGASPTAAMVNNGTLGFGIKVKLGAVAARWFFYADKAHMSLTVWYTVASTNQSQILMCTQFGFNTTNSILGVTATFQASASAQSLDGALYAQLIYKNALLGSSDLTTAISAGQAKLVNAGPSVSMLTLGAPNDLWGDSITSTIVDDPSFGIAFITKGGGSWSVNDVQLTLQTTAGQLISSACNSASILSTTNEPKWSTIWGAQTLDGVPPTQITWICQGPNLQKFAISPPNTVPSVSNIPLPANSINTISTWAANTWYLASLSIVDSNNNIEKITTAGTTGSSQPTWNANTGGTTSEAGHGGTAVWTNQGTAAWQASHGYSVGNVVSVTYNQVTPVGVQAVFGSTFYFWAGHVNQYGSISWVNIVTSRTDFFQCITAGTSGSVQPNTLSTITATTPLPTWPISSNTWQTGIGTHVTDGTVVWANIGPSVHWTDIGASQTLSNANNIIDSNGNTEQATKTGETGTTVPTWLAPGSTVVDNQQTWFNVGPAASGSSIAAASLAQSTLKWLYYYTWRNSLTGDESTASPASTPISVALNSQIQVSGSYCPDMQCDTIRIYRTTLGGATPLLLTEIPNTSLTGTWAFVDNSTPDDQLNVLIQAPLNHVNDPPPVGLINMAFHLQRIFGSVGNTVFYSNGSVSAFPGNPSTAFDPLNFFIYPSKVTRLVPMDSGLWVWTTSEIYIIRGQGTISSPFYSQPFANRLGLLSYNELDVNGAIIYVKTADNQVVELHPGVGFQESGFPIGDQFKTLTTGTGVGFTPGQCYVTWHIQGSEDKALFVANGVDGWFKHSPTAAPESGFHWSPKATLTNAGGVKAVQSIETSPGVFSLLLGPATSGPILVRNLDYVQPALSGNGGTASVADNINGEVILAGQESIVVSAGVAKLALNINKNDAVIVFVADANDETIVVTDDGGNTYVQYGSTVQINFGTSVPTGAQYFRVFVANPAKTVTATQITVTATAPEELKILAAAYSNCAGFGKFASNTGISAFPTITISPSNPNSLIVAGFNWEPGVLGVEKVSGDVGIAIGQ